jgi:hypothetical protein
MVRRDPTNIPDRGFDDLYNGDKVALFHRGVYHHKISWDESLKPSTARQRVTFAPASFQDDLRVCRMQSHMQRSIAWMSMAHLASAGHHRWRD